MQAAQAGASEHETITSSGRLAVDVGDVRGERIVVKKFRDSVASTRSFLRSPRKPPFDSFRDEAENSAFSGKACSFVHPSDFDNSPLDRKNAERALPNCGGQIPARQRALPVNHESPYRKLIVELLQLFASEEQQLAYERNVRHVDITAELVCMWFDDLYHSKEQHFETCFTPAELAALDEFHRFYDVRVDRLPESKGTVRTWLDSPVWREVMEQARRTLEQVPA